MRQVYREVGAGDGVEALKFRTSVAGMNKSKGKIGSDMQAPWPTREAQDRVQARRDRGLESGKDSEGAIQGRRVGAGG